MLPRRSLPSSSGTDLRWQLEEKLKPAHTQNFLHCPSSNPDCLLARPIFTLRLETAANSEKWAIIIVRRQSGKALIVSIPNETNVGTPKVRLYVGWRGSA